MWRRRLVVGILLAPLLVGAIALIVPDSRYQILAALRQDTLVDGRPAEYWIAVLKDGDASERRRAAINLGETGLCTDVSKKEPICSRVTETLAIALGDDDGLVRKCAATSFLLLPRELPVSDDRVPTLLDALSDREVAVRRAAIRGLWQVGASAKRGDGVAKLTTSLADEDVFVRMYAARALAKIGPDAKAAVPVLIERVRTDEESDVRKLSAKALGLIGPAAVGALLPEANKALMPSLKAEDAELREYTARALGQLGSIEAIPALRQAAEDRDKHVREAVVEALKRLEAKKSS